MGCRWKSQSRWFSHYCVSNLILFTDWLRLLLNCIFAAQHWDLLRQLWKRIVHPFCGVCSTLIQSGSLDCNFQFFLFVSSWSRSNCGVHLLVPAPPLPLGSSSSMVEVWLDDFVSDNPRHPPQRPSLLPSQGSFLLLVEKHLSLLVFSCFVLDLTNSFVILTLCSLATMRLKKTRLSSSEIALHLD